MMSNLNHLFDPGSIALVGVPRGFKAGKVFLLGLLDQGFKGPVYPVHPHASEIDGLRAYPSLSEVPDPVDMVIVMAPRQAVAGILEACAAKKVKTVILYTSGFGETGEAQGLEEESRMRDTARRAGFRLLGPNCMGVYSPGSGLAPFPGMPRVPGRVGFLTQSGSLGNLFTNACAPRKIFLRHMVSYGNSCDVALPELLDYMASDHGVHIICSYCEGVKDGKAMARALGKLHGRKPVIMWKVGRTRAGKRAAASHTGSLAGRQDVWKAVFRQFGILDVSNMQEMLDGVMAFYHLPWQGKGRVALVSGPGGPLVSAADALEGSGLTLAHLGRETLQRLEKILPPTGTCLQNPVDVGLAASFDLNQYLDTLEILAEDREVDAMVVLGGGVTPEMNEKYVQGLTRIRQASGKALLAIAFPGFLTDETLLAPLYEAGVPVYPTPERALHAYSMIQKFLDHREKRVNNQGPKEQTLVETQKN